MRKILLFVVGMFAISIATQAQFALKNVMIEEFTGAWCGWCPDGAVILENMENTYTTRLNTVSIHSGDAMEFSDGGTIANFYTSSYPSATIDRTSLGVGRGSWGGEVNSRLQSFPAAGVSIENMTYNSGTRQLDFTVRADFQSTMVGEYRLNAFLVEDHIDQAGSGYNQVNYLNNQAGHPYQGAGDPIIGYDHRHVLRACLGGPWGVTGSVPTTNYGDSAFYTFSTTLPANWDENEVSIVGFVAEFGSAVGDREILNSSEVDVVIATSMDEGNPFESLSLTASPVPSDGMVSLHFNMEKTAEMDLSIFDLTGRKVTTVLKGMMPKGMNKIEWMGLDENGAPAANGIYLAKFTADGKQVVKRVVINR